MTAMTLEELIERAERGQIIGDGSQQIKLLVEQKRWAFDRLKRLQAEQVSFREPERTIVCNVLANGIPASMPERRPQRFKYRTHGSTVWEFGAVFATGQRLWTIIADKGFASFHLDPWEAMGLVIGDVADFRWIDNDFGWRGGNE